MLLEKFIKAKKIHPPDWLYNNVHYLADCGSRAYGTETPESDIDCFGFCTPKKEMVFPHLAGIIKNFGNQGENFLRWSESHVFDDDGLEYDFSVLNIVHFFHLCSECNPDQIDVLFVPRECIRHITPMGELVRENRHKFLSKRAYYKYKGYAFSQINKSCHEVPTGKRKELRDKFGYDVKFASHVKRLVLECEMILKEGDLDLRRNKEEIKYVKQGLMSLSDLKLWFADKERYLEICYQNSKLPEVADERELKNLLLKCLESHYGSLDKCIVEVSDDRKTLQKIKELVKHI